MNKSKAQKSLDRLFNYCEEIDNHLPVNEKAHYIMLPDVLELQRFINNTVEVIHCKDCKYYTEYFPELHKSKKKVFYCCGGFVDSQMALNPDDYCSYAERKSKVKRCFDIPENVANMLLEDTERKEAENDE